MGKSIFRIKLKSNNIENFYSGEKVARKSKKLIKKLIKDNTLPTYEEVRWLKLPDCKWCDGSGHYRDHPSDTGYSCPDCYATGKQGWMFSNDDTKVEVNTGLKVSEC